MLAIHLTGYWVRGEVALRWAPSSYRSTPETEAAIAAEWKTVKARLGDRIFDGPMCRLENVVCRSSDDPRREIEVPLQHPPVTIDAPQSRLELSLSTTSYRIFTGTNMMHPEWMDTLGRQMMAYTVGVSTLLITADNHAMLGQRSDNVAYYPHKLHPFSGSLEPQVSKVEGEASTCPNLFDEALRELNEELGLCAEHITEIACIGIIEDRQLRHPETVLFARTTKTRRDVEQSLQGNEHTDAWNCPATPDAIQQVLNDRSLFTPVAQGALQLFADHLRLRCSKM